MSRRRLVSQGIKYFHETKPNRRLCGVNFFICLQTLIQNHTFAISRHRLSCCLSHHFLITSLLSCDKKNFFAFCLCGNLQNRKSALKTNHTLSINIPARSFICVGVSLLHMLSYKHFLVSSSIWSSSKTAGFLKI